MCLQCTTQATVVKADILPGFSLMQSQLDSPEWPKGFYGLVETNDPTLVFAGPLLKDPTHSLGDDELNALPGFPAGTDEFDAAAWLLRDQLVLDAVTGWRIVQACIERGYRPAEDGYLHRWLMQYMAMQVESVTDVSAS
jgi:hypothetical protein